jgi:hypothetical protein
MIKLLNILKEEPYIDLNKSKIGTTSIDSETGTKTTLSDINPETGKLTWDVDYGVKPEIVITKLEGLIDYLGAAEEGTELSKLKGILQLLRKRVKKLK